MRCDQCMGLNERGNNLVYGKVVHLYSKVEIHVYPDGKIKCFGPEAVNGVNTTVEITDETYSGAFNGDYTLHRHIFPDGKVLTEALQETIWSSGPMMFLALKDETGNWVPESLWTQEEMENS